MWWWRKVRRADIPDDLRARFELFGVDVLVHAIAAGDLSIKGGGLDALLREKRREMLAWLQEQRDKAQLHDDRVETVEWAILLFVVFGVFCDVALLIHR